MGPRHDHSADESDLRYLRTLTVLYVEDDESVRALMVELLSRRVREVIPAASGRAGLDAFRARRPDLVVTDIRMPGMDGLSMAAEIRALAPDVPIIVITAFEQTDYLVRSIDLGIDKYVVKPLDPRRFEAALLHCARKLRAEAELVRRGRLEVELRRHETMALLAGGMAHDYNNLVQAILGNVGLARSIVGEEGEVAELLRAAEQSSTEATRLGRTLVLLAPRSGLLDEQVPVLATVREAAEGVLAGSGVVHELVAGPRIDAETVVRGERRQIAVLVENLLSNAVEAMPRGGTLRTLITREQLAGGQLPLAEGAYLHLAMTDGGKGVPPAVLPLVFDPYFSTKPRGAARATGLGLTVCRAIASRHAGAITLDSPPGQGATAHLYLPLPASDPPAPPPVET